MHAHPFLVMTPRRRHIGVAVVLVARSLFCRWLVVWLWNETKLNFNQFPKFNIHVTRDFATRARKVLATILTVMVPLLIPYSHLYYLYIFCM